MVQGGDVQFLRIISLYSFIHTPPLSLGRLVWLLLFALHPTDPIQHSHHLRCRFWDGRSMSEQRESGEKKEREREEKKEDFLLSSSGRQLRRRRRRKRAREKERERERYILRLRLRLARWRLCFAVCLADTGWSVCLLRLRF